MAALAAALVAYFIWAAKGNVKLKSALEAQTAKRIEAEQKLAVVTARFDEVVKQYQIRIGLEYHEKRKKGFFGESHDIEVFKVFYCGDIPVGAPQLAGSKAFKRIDDENVKFVLKEVMVPLVSAGFKVAVAAAG